MAEPDTMPSKLVQVVYALSPGGSELLATRLASRFNRDGRYATAVYALAHGGALEPVLAAEGVQHRAFGRARGVDAAAFLRLVRAMRALRPAIVHTHHLGQLMYGGPAARLTGARLVHTEHEFYTLAQPRHRRLLRTFTALADVVTAVAEPVTDFLHRRVGISMAKLQTVSNGVDMDLFRTAKPADRAAWGWTGEQIVLACIGRLSPEKGQRLLLEAFREVTARRPDARLLFVGDGEDRRMLETSADSWGLSGVTRFLGARPDVPGMLAACDVVVLPSHHEGLPLVAIEAMAAGKPVIATAVGALPRLMDAGRHGCLVPPGDPEALAEAIVALLADPDRRQRLSSSGRQLVEQHYNFLDTVRRYDTVYQSVLQRRRGR